METSKILTALKSMTRDEQIIIQLYFYESLKTKEISIILNIAEDKVKAAYTKLLTKLGINQISQAYRKRERRLHN